MAMKGYRTKKIALPGGRVIEIVYFAETAEAGSADDQAQGQESPEALVAAVAAEEQAAAVYELHVCESCESGLVYPVSWEERSGDTWRIDRRCPNCEWRHTGEFSQDDVEVFDDTLNEGTEELLVALRNVARANMEADVERLIDAIQLDLIQPMDF
jgi:hypothetical protein